MTVGPLCGPDLPTYGLFHMSEKENLSCLNPHYLSLCDNLILRDPEALFNLFCADGI